jgi:signal transduction histidine kinase/ActR/RegA family two-component response regulator
VKEQWRGKFELGDPKVLGLLVLILGAGLLVATLLLGQYRGAVAQRIASDRDFQAHASTQSANMGHFLDRVSTETEELVQRRVVSAYFANKALGLTMEYGLRISLLDLRQELASRLKRSLPSGHPVFCRMILVDRDTLVIWDSENPDAEPGAAWEELYAFPGEAWSSSGLALIHTVPCFIHEREVGRLLAYIPLDTVTGILNPPQDPVHSSSWLAWRNGQPLTATCDQQDLAQLRAVQDEGLATEGVLHTRFTSADGTNRSLLAACSPLKEMPFQVIRIQSQDDAAAGTDPRRILATLILALGAVVGGSFMISRSQAREAALADQLVNETEQKKRFHAKNQELAEEVQKRQATEKRLRLAVEQAEEANRAKSQFLANMSHEIRTPLNGLLGLTELVLDDEVDPSHREYLEIALDSGKSLLQIINDILDFSRIEAGRLDINPEAFSLPEMLNSITKSFRAALQNKELTLALDLASGIPDRMVGDPTRIRQVLVNLVGNAVKFTAEGGVTLKASWVPSSPRFGSMVFQVSDTGIGIPPEKLDRIFEAFTQADGSTTRKFGGTGLGLTISCQLADLMQGTLTAESQVGQGSRFTFQIPMEVPADQPTEADASPLDATDETDRPLKILVAEDNEVNRFYIQKLLDHLGHEMVLVENGVLALEALEAQGPEKFDLVLLDIQMPELDGLFTARIWREKELNSGLTRLPLIALTAHALEGDRQDCLDAGMDDFLTKPLNTEKLESALKRWGPRPTGLKPAGKRTATTGV